MSSAASTTGSTATRRPSAVVDSVPGFFEDCLILADDFRQYYLGAFVRASIADPSAVAGSPTPMTASTASSAGRSSAATTRSTRPAPSSRRATCCRWRSSRSSPARGGRVRGRRRDPFAPVEGTRYAAAVHADDSYMRLTQDGRPDRRDDRAAAVPAVAELRGGLRPRHRRGPHGRPGQLDDAGRDRRRDVDRPAGGVRRPGLPARRCTRSCATTSAGRTARRRARPDVELDHRLDRRLAAGRLRPVGVRRPAGRGVADLRHRPEHRRRRRVRRRHARRRRRRHRRPTASRARRARGRSAPRRPAARRRRATG